MSADPHEILDDLDDDSDSECLFVERRRGDAYIWRAEDGGYYVLDRSGNGSWLPYPRPVDGDTAADIIEAVIESDDDAYEVRPQTKIPPDRHHLDT